MIEIYVIRQDELVLIKPLEERLLIGCDPSCDICLPGKLSSVHASIEAIGSKIILKALSGEVYYNGQRVAGAMALKSKDIFDLGEYRFQINEKEAPSKNFTCKTLTATHNSTQTDAADEMPSFVVHQPERKSFCQTHIVIGRGSNCDLSIPDDPVTRKNVSRRHAEIYVSRGKYYIRDLRSKNGTTLYDFKIAGKPLPRRGTICLGKYELPYEIAASPKSLAAMEGIEIPSINPNIPSKKLIGSSSAMKVLFTKLNQTLETEQTVLILGENGTGKDLCARYLHFYHPKRKKGPFVAVNCASIPHQLAESYFFGHTKGAFTGAVEDSAGVFEQANRGTLFLDEIGELTAETQAQLLRVLEDRMVRPVGSVKQRAVDVRVILATNRNIEEDRQKGKFRNDLYYRCQNFIRVPSLRERTEDIEHLVQYFLSCSGKPIDISPQALEIMNLYPWPGNVRELSSVIERAILNATFRNSNVIAETDLDIRIDVPTFENVIPESPKDTFKDQVLTLLEDYRGNVKEVAKTLHVQRKTIYNWMKKIGITSQEFRR